MEMQSPTARRASDTYRALARATRPLRENAAIGMQTARFQLERAEDAARTLAAVAGQEGARAGRRTLDLARRAPIRTALIVAGAGLVAALLLNGKARRRSSARSR
jgi:hypothetical protein